MSKRLTHRILIGSTLLFALTNLPALAQQHDVTRGGDAASPFQSVASKHERHYRHGNDYRHDGKYRHGGRHDGKYRHGGRHDGKYRHDARRGKWIPGHWRWIGHRRVWIEGRWVQGPPRGYGRPPHHRYQGQHRSPNRHWAPPPPHRPWWHDR